MRKRKTQAIGLLLALAMVLGLLPGTARAAGGTLEGDGTGESPYLIADAADLAAFRDLVNAEPSSTKYAKLTADIQLSGEWTPINPESGYVTEAYAGIFDGGGHAIRGLSINATAANQGLFGMINGAAIKNLRVEGSVYSTRAYVGGIVGKIQQGTIENCSFSGSVETGAAGSSAYAGGIAGYAGNSAAQTAAIVGCVNHGTIKGCAAGGIAGYAKYTTITNCYNTGSITGSFRSGGIAGQLQNNGILSRCYNMGEVTGSTGANEICEFVYSSAKVETCFGRETSSANILKNLGSPFIADTNNINSGYPILSWQAGAAPEEPKDPHITISGSSALYMTNGGTQPTGTLRVQYPDMDAVPIEWTVTSGQDVIALSAPENADANSTAQIVSILAPGRAIVTAAAGGCSDTWTLTVYPCVTAVRIGGTTAVGETVRAQISTLGGGELDDEMFPVSVQWKYLTAEDYSAGNTGASAYKTIPGAVGQTYTIPVSLENAYLSFTLRWNGEDMVPGHPSLVRAEGYKEPDPINPDQPDRTLEAAAASLGTLRPVYGTDTNLCAMVQDLLADKGCAGADVSISAVEEVYGGAGLAANGDVTYFYADPNDTESIWFARYQVTFTLSKGETTLNKEVPVVVCWDAGRVEETMTREILDQVTLDTNAPVTGNLTLPKVVDGKKWALISWQSSNEEVISISAENQATADTLFAPYVGVVKQGQAAQTVTLTAAFTFQLTNAVGEKPITLFKVFPVTVPAIGDAAADEVRRGLLAKLDAGFSAKGLTDAMTGERLIPDENGVYTAVNDIQLPTTQDFGVDGKYYPVSITTDNGGLLKAPDVNNAARVEVYRPMGADAEGTITVTLRDRDTSVAASKTLRIRVPAITQAEIEAELALMERVKATYFEGIKGGNASRDDVRTDLVPFFEVYEENGELVWVRSAGGKMGRGIVPVPMEGWEDLELWRLFRSSNPNVISHENLLVTRQAQPKAVTITSRLSSERLGRYGEPYQKNPVQYARYAGLAPLYYQEATTDAAIQPAAPKGRAAAPVLRAQADTIVVRGTENPSNAIPVVETIGVSFALTRLDGQAWTSASFTGLDEASTVYDVFVKALGGDYTATRVKGTYIKAISGPHGTLTEKQYGEDSGWMYRVNGKIPEVYMGACPLHNGDSVQVFYTRDANKDDPNYSRPSGGNSPGAASPAGGPSSSGSGGSNQANGSASQEIRITEGSSNGTYSITLPGDNHGPRLVTLPEGRAGQLVVIKYADGREEVVKKSVLENGKTRFLLKESAEIRLRDYRSAFADIAEDAWCRSAVDFVSGRGLFMGVDEQHFSPDRPLSRGMLVTVLFRLEEPDTRQTEALFADIADDDWCAREIAWAAETGIVTGYGDGCFHPGNSITREQLAVILFRYAKAVGMNTGGRDSLTGFSDSGTVGSWSWDAMAWAVDNGIINGRADGTLAPAETASRAQTAAMIQRLITLLLK